MSAVIGQAHLFVVRGGGLFRDGPDRSRSDQIRSDQGYVHASSSSIKAHTLRSLTSKSHPSSSNKKSLTHLTSSSAKNHLSIFFPLGMLHLTFT